MPHFYFHKLYVDILQRAMARSSWLGPVCLDALGCQIGGLPSTSCWILYLNKVLPKGVCDLRCYLVKPYLQDSAVKLNAMSVLEGQTREPLRCWSTPKLCRAWLLIYENPFSIFNLLPECFGGPEWRVKHRWAKESNREGPPPPSLPPCLCSVGLKQGQAGQQDQNPKQGQKQNRLLCLR